MKFPWVSTLRQSVWIVLLGGVAAIVHAYYKPIQVHSSLPGGGTVSGSSRFLQLTVSDARSLYDSNSGAFIDTREPNEYKESHVPGAYSLPFSSFVSGRPTILDYLPTGIPLIVYCEGGDCHVSEQVCEMLLDYGFSNLRILSEGWPGWKNGGHPTETGPPSSP